METPVDINKFDSSIPSWVKGAIGSVAAILLLPPIALSIVMKFGGFESIVQDYAKAQLKISEPMVKSNDNLAIQMLELNRTMTVFKDQVDDLNKVMDERLSAVEDTLTIHSAQIQSGLKELQHIQRWANEHSLNGNVNYEP